MRLQPYRLLIGGLAVAGIAKLALSAGVMPDDTAVLERLALVGPAEAAANDAAEPQPQAAAPVAGCEMPEEMLAAIQKERELLATQKDELAQRRSEVDLAAEKVQVETERLTELKTEVEALLARVEKAKSEDLDRLIGLYGNMKSKDAAAIMNDLDIEVTVMVLGAMPEREAAPIMAAMSPVRVRAVSKILLERSKLPGDQKLDGIRLK
jgi:flagellar motility protein MotE (MotC chaperone)